MTSVYEVLRLKDTLPVKLVVSSGQDLGLKLQRQVEVILLLEDSIRLRIRSEDFHLREGNLFIINSGSVYEIEGEGENPLYLSLTLDKSFFSNYYEDFSKDYFSLENLSQGDLLHIKSHLARMAQVISHKSIGYELSLAALSFSLVDLLVKKAITSYEKLNMEKDKHLDRLERILTYMDENFDNGISLVQVAEYENLSMYYTSHFIKKHLGMSFQDYINMKRLEKSIYLLIKTNKSIGDISRESGFPSPKAFNNMFNKYYKGTPSKFRKNGWSLQSKSNTMELAALLTSNKLGRYLET